MNEDYWRIFKYEKIAKNLEKISHDVKITFQCRDGGMEDAGDSKSPGGNPVRVQLPLPANNNW